ncbi:hypothetical protein [Bacteroides sp.]|uniref:hypothetical protein n=1 Tax=Bacteroides sp. TaxID=29523 RepID=UPI00263A2F13|nr:hypothetical protein [Bacteroides sp.]MDD3040409.1 hypothetical protein [Bacteroides sp.]
MNIFHEWGFTETPFKTHPLPADENGKALLVNRKNEIKQLKKSLSSSSNLVTIEGDNGVGKTSLVNIAVYEMFDDYLRTGVGPLFIPCDARFQLSADIEPEDFIDEVLMAVAQTLLKRGKELKDRGFYLENGGAIIKWLNSPLINGYSGSVNIVKHLGFGVGTTQQANPGAGFLKSGFKTTVLNWLSDIFPPYESLDGGIVCILDNMELLQTSQIAREQIERFRDKVFAFTGLRWVLCGSMGIMRGVASSPRLHGRMNMPINLCGVDFKYAIDILLTRIKRFEIVEDKGYLPINCQEFEHLYKILHNNTRNALNYANNYCLDVSDSNLPLTNEEKRETFYKWLNYQSKEKIKAVMTLIKPRALEVFKQIIECNGELSPSDYDIFGFKNWPTMRRYISQLEVAGLVTSIIDESDKRRKTILVTAEGWFFNYSISLQ